MLTAVLSGKRRGTGFAGKQLLLGTTEGAEDVLTSTVFERLAYLPESVFSSFINHLFMSEEELGVLEDIEFWPSWEFENQCVEPDVVLYGTKRAVLIEAKRHDNSRQQYSEQLARELKAGMRLEELGDNPILLTIGGLQDYSDKEVHDLWVSINKALGNHSYDYTLICRSWYQLSQALLSAISEADHIEPGLQRLWSDIVATYKWHGLRTQIQCRLGELLPVSIQSDHFPLHQFRSAFDDPFLKKIKSMKSPLSRLITLLSRKKNSAASNYDFDRKKAAYFTKGGVCSFAITTKVLQHDTWTVNVIAQRQNEMLGVLEAHWRLRDRKSKADIAEALLAELANVGGGAVFELESAKHGLNAIARESGDAFIVLEGSKARKGWTGQPHSYQQLRQQLLDDGSLSQCEDGSGLVFTRDVEFSSPSAASATVLARTDNGRNTWRLKGTSVTYAAWQDNLPANQPATGRTES